MSKPERSLSLKEFQQHIANQGEAFDHRSAALLPSLIEKPEKAESQGVEKAQKIKFYTTLQEAFANLTKTEARILRLTYGLTGGTPLKYSQIGANDGTPAVIIENEHDNAINALSKHEPLTEIAQQYQFDGTTQDEILLEKILDRLTERTETDIQEEPTNTPQQKRNALEAAFANASPEEQEAFFGILYPKQKEIADLCLNKNLSINEIAKLLNISTRYIGTVRHTLKKKLKHPEQYQEKRETLEDTFANTSPEKQEAFFKSLTPRQEQIADLCLNKNLSINEIAKLLNLSKSYIGCARNTLKKKLEQPEQPPKKSETVLEKEYTQLTPEERKILQETLSPKHARIIEGRFGQGLNQTETASLLQVSLMNLQKNEYSIIRKIKKIKETTNRPEKKSQKNAVVVWWGNQI